MTESTKLKIAAFELNVDNLYLAKIDPNYLSIKGNMFIRPYLDPKIKDTKK